MRIEAPATAQVPQLLRLWKDSFGEYNGFWELFLETAFAPERCRCILDGHQTAASLCWFDTECAGQKMAYLYAVVTDPAHRGRGLCRQLVEDTHKHLAARGYTASLLVPAEEGLRSMYRKMGYETCTAVTEFSCNGAAAPISLRAIGPEAYARLRREYLPEKAVLQEGENLSFLSQQAQFYVGAAFLMAAHTEGDTLRAMEFLGDASAAPAIIASLNCRRGEFRMPGQDKPFAMWHPLAETAAVPAYFGFAFD